MDNNATNVILAYLDTISRDLAMKNKRLDRMVSQREQVGYPNTRQEEGRSSCELRGKNTIPYTPMNLECCVVASSGQLDVVADLRRVEVFQSTFGDTLGDVRLREDQTLVVSTQALVDPLDDEIDSFYKNNLCPSSANLYNLNKVLLPIDKSTHTLVDPCTNQGESNLVCELPTTSEDVNEDQLTHECIPLLEHMCGVLKKSQVSDGVYRVDLNDPLDSLNILCGKILAGANEGRQGSSLSLFVDDDLFLCAIYTKDVLLVCPSLILQGSNSRSNPFSRKEDDTDQYSENSLDQHSNCFLKSCFFCHKAISQHKEVYIYRGELGFCSADCRNKQIYLDELKKVETYTKKMLASLVRQRRRGAGRCRQNIVASEDFQQHGKPSSSTNQVTFTIS
ncbi:hypothetical protein CQW23_15003 [Capsicum baccatum]|uniref:FLZ-type domain-containing protein n=1 Tax=Capsicum baccatum TaxID=33114 RepID=A0A2G2WKS2_CAPBA|nr:hypothetical protein CQW23_15003 [Capsicum baccatum]